MRQDLVRQTVLDLEPYEWEASSQVIAQRHGLDWREVVRFDLNTSPFAPASWEPAMDGARDLRLPNEYWDTAYAELTALIADYCEVRADQLVIGAGADEILDVISKTVLDNGDGAVIAPPTYSMYAIVTRQMGGIVRAAPLRPDFGLDVDAILKASHGAKLIWLCQPNSPTGNLLDPADVRQVVERADCVVVIDEAYAEIADYTSLPLVEANPNLIVVRTMSKGFGLAGLRLGWAVAQPELAGLLNRVRPPNSVSYVTARVGAAALTDVPAMRQQVAAIVAEREPFATRLRALGAHVYPSRTNFLLTRWRDPAEAQAAANWLERHGLVVRNFARHPLLPGHLRITVRAPVENTRLVAALTAWRQSIEVPAR